MSSSDQPSSLRPEIPRRGADLGAGAARPGAPLGGAVPAGAPAPRPSADPKTLIVGRDISLNGEISTCHRLVVEGKVEAALSDCNSIEVSETGLFKGAAEVQEADVRGRFEGKLTVKGRLMVRAQGAVTGEITYGQLEVECGGQLAGTVKSAGTL